MLQLWQIVHTLLVSSLEQGEPIYLGRDLQNMLRFVIKLSQVCCK